MIMLCLIGLACFAGHTAAAGTLRIYEQERPQVRPADPCIWRAIPKTNAWHDPCGVSVPDGEPVVVVEAVAPEVEAPRGPVVKCHPQDRLPRVEGSE